MDFYERLLRLLERHKDNEREMKLIFRFAQGLTGEGRRR